mgnify:CR=1 FL=1
MSDHPFSRDFNVSPDPIRRGSAPQPPWEKIPRDDWRFLLAIGDRASKIIADTSFRFPAKNIVAPSPTQCACDVAVVHLLRNLDLARFFYADDLDFAAEYLTIAGAIDRREFTFPSFVMLKFVR